MADYYTEFSIELDYPRPALIWIRDELIRISDDTDEYICTATLQNTTEGKTTLWLAGTNPDLNAVVDILCKAQRKLKLEEPCCIQWADYCSKPRVDAFGGGAVFIHKGKASWWSTLGFVEEKLGKLRRKQKKMEQQL